MNGNISAEGIKLDLEWMHRVGIGGVTIFEGAIDTPQVVPHRLIYMTPEWKQAFRYAVTTRPLDEYGSRHRQLARLERNRRTVGARVPGHEEDGVVGDARRRRQAVHGQARRIRHRSMEPFRIIRFLAAAHPTEP